MSIVRVAGTKGDQLASANGRVCRRRNLHDNDTGTAFYLRTQRDRVRTLIRASWLLGDPLAEVYGGTRPPAINGKVKD